MKKTTLISILLIVFFLQQQNAKAQFGELEVQACTDSMDVINLFDSVFFSNFPPQTISNLTFQGDPAAVGYYYDGGFIGFNRGIVLTTGLAEDVDISNVCYTNGNANTDNDGIEQDEDIMLIGNSNYSRDNCIIEFDFRPITDIVRINYVFASEEYHYFVTSDYVDRFAILVSGEGIEGVYSNNSENMALVPNTSLDVNINTINIGDGDENCLGKPTGCTNCQYYKDNSQSSGFFFNYFVYDGYTSPLMASHSLQHGQWYHIKIVIGEVGDPVFDSALFFGKGSFNTGNHKTKPIEWIMD